MSNVNNLISVPTVTDETGGYRKKYSVVLADLKGLGAFVTGDVILETFPVGTIIMASRIKHSVAVTGTSYAVVTARLFFGTPGGSETAMGAAALDVFAAPSDTDSTTVTSIVPTISPTTLAVKPSLFMRLLITTYLWNAATAGQIDAYCSSMILL